MPVVLRAKSGRPGRAAAQPRSDAGLLGVPGVGDGGGGAVELGDIDGEGLVVGARPVSEEAESDGLAEEERCIGVAAPVDAGVGTMAEGDVVPELVKFAIHGELPGIRAGVRV